MVKQTRHQQYWHTGNNTVLTIMGLVWGAIFVNLEKLFPCANGIPLCRLFPYEDDGFRKGKALIETADSGNTLQIFGGNNNKTYGFAFTGCPVLNGANGCLPSGWQRILVCYLPNSCRDN